MLIVLVVFVTYIDAKHRPIHYLHFPAVYLVHSFIRSLTHGLNTLNVDVFGVWYGMVCGVIETNHKCE
jgi:hypothetical protein